MTERVKLEPGTPNWYAVDHAGKALLDFKCIEMEDGKPTCQGCAMNSDIGCIVVYLRLIV